MTHEQSPDTWRIAHLESRLASARRDIFLLAMLMFAGIFWLGDAFPDLAAKEAGALVLALATAIVYLRRAVLDWRDARRARELRKQAFEASISTMIKDKHAQP